MKYLRVLVRSLLIGSVFFTLNNGVNADTLDFEGVIYNGSGFSSIHTGSDASDSSDWTGLFTFDDNQEFLFSMDDNLFEVSAGSQFFSLDGGDATFELISMNLILNDDYSFSSGELSYNITGDQQGTDNYGSFEFEALNSGIFNTTSFDEDSGVFSATLWGGDDSATYTGSETVCTSWFMVCWSYETVETTEAGLGTDLGFTGTVVATPMSSVPEPSILLLLGSGLLLLSLRRLKK